MKRILTLALVVGAAWASTASACPGVSWQKAAASVGKTITLHGTVTSTHFTRWKSGKGSMTFLDFGAPYPSPHRFTVIVWNADVSKLAGKSICVRGAVKAYNGSRELEVDSPASIRK